MTDDNSKTSSEENLVDIDDLDAFSKDFFQIEEPEKKEEEKVVENENDQLATDDDKDASEDEKPAEDEDEDEVEEEAPKPEPKPKSKAQKRIEALNTQVRETERQNADLLRRLEALEAKKEVAKDEAVPALRERLPADAPNPDASDKDGNPIYPLGEFDPMFIRDITKYSVNKEFAEVAARTAQEAEAAKMAQAQKEIQEGWLDRLDTYEKEVPEIREDIEDLVNTFQGLDPAYGEYLASVIMANERGPELMHYLSQNIGEAQKIVASGPTAAIFALGRIEARLDPKQGEKRNIKKQSDAPAPPEARSRGSGGKFAVSPDTDDLDAFERIFFNKK